MIAKGADRMANLKSRFRQVFACMLATGMLIGGLSFTALPVSAEDQYQSGDFGSGKLTGVSLDVYRYLKEEIKKTAAGSRQSAEYDISSIVQTLGEAEELNTSLETINDYLLMDCPYDLYWYDKSAKDANPGVAGAIRLNYNYTSGGQAKDVIVRMLVSKEYRSENPAGSGESWYYTVDAGRTQKARTIPAKAQDIVNAHADKSDYEKLLAYKNAICDLVVYDEAAVGPNYQLSNEPWQLISVFDGDPNTNVVCEGYSKAFQYLCDLSEFDNARCYTVSGGMAGGTGSGFHMWNIVTIDGANYITDVTNCDAGTVGAPNLLFLAAPSEGSWDTQYNFSAGINYKYDNVMHGLFGEDILKLADKSYEAPVNSGASEQPAPSGDETSSGQPDHSGNPSVSENPDASGQQNNTGNQTPSGQSDNSAGSDTSDKKEQSEKSDDTKKKKKPKKTGSTKKQDTSETDSIENSKLGVEILDPSIQGEYQVVEEGIRATYVKNGDELEFVDASKIEDVVRGKLTQKHKLAATDVQVHEIALKVKNDKGEWEDAAAEKFPKSGIKITMPYPTGTNKNFQFYGQHLFAEDVNGYKAGTIENLEITKEDGGISFVVHGLSPVSIGWSDQETVEDAENSQEAVSDRTGRNTSQRSDNGGGQQETRTKSPKTADDSAVMLYVVLMLLAVGTGIVYRRRIQW
jgi:hypothetical protein